MRFTHRAGVKGLRYWQGWRTTKGKNLGGEGGKSAGLLCGLEGDLAVAKFIRALDAVLKSIRV